MMYIVTRLDQYKDCSFLYQDGREAWEHGWNINSGTSQGKPSFWRIDKRKSGVGNNTHGQLTLISNAAHGIFLLDPDIDA